MYSILRISGSLNGHLQDGDGRYVEFIADTADDISALPTGNESEPQIVKPRPGSMAVCTGNRNLYILSNARVWVLFVEAQQ